MIDERGLVGIERRLGGGEVGLGEDITLESRAAWMALGDGAEIE